MAKQGKQTRICLYNRENYYARVERLDKLLEVVIYENM